MKDERTLKEKIRDRWNTIKWKVSVKFKKLMSMGKPKVYPTFLLRRKQ